MSQSLNSQSAAGAMVADPPDAMVSASASAPGNLGIGSKGRKDVAQLESPNSDSKSTTARKRNRSRKELGRRGEEAAVRFLYNRGYEVLERNWTCFAGEADIIARDGETLVFIEVKTRTGYEKGFPGEAVTASKRDRYEKIALAYLSNTDGVDFPIRFDVISIVVMASDRAMVRHHINAFSSL